MSLSSLCQSLCATGKTFVPALLDTGAKGMAILLLTCIAALVMRRASAAARHLVWFLGTFCLLLLPVLTAALPGLHILPRWDITKAPVPEPAPLVTSGSAPWVEMPASDANVPPFDASPRYVTPRPAPQTPLVSTTAPPVTLILSTAPTSLTWQGWVLLGWLTGVAMYLAFLLFACLSLWLLRRRSSRTTDTTSLLLLGEACDTLDFHRPVELLSSPRRAMPMTWGIFRTWILLPGESTDWTSEQRRAVLLHELAHAKRCDCQTQLLVQFATALHWFNPLIWFAQRRMQAEREQACDDRVLSAGTKASAYAEQLLQIASEMSPPRFSAAAIAMARPSKLEGRLLAILDVKRNRRALSWSASLVALFLIAFLAAPVAMLRAGPDSPAANPKATRNTGNPGSPAYTPAAPGVHLPASAATSRPAGVLDLVVLDAATHAPLGDVAVESSGGEEKLITTADGHVTVIVPAQAHTNFAVFLNKQHYVGKMLAWGSPDQSARDSVPASYTVEMTAGQTVGGRLLDDAGQPIAGAHVVIRTSGSNSSEPHEHIFVHDAEAETGIDGRWSFDGVPLKFETIDIGLWDYHHVTNQSGWGFYEIGSYTPASALLNRTATFTMHRGVTIAGVVLGPDGKPLRGARVGFGGDRSGSNTVPALATGPDGRFSFTFTAGSPVVLTAIAKGVAPQLIQLTADANKSDVVIQMTRGQHLSGRVIDADGKPLSAFVWPDTWRGNRTLGDKAMRTDADGRFHWDDAPADAIAVDVSAEDCMMSNLVSITAGAENNITLQKSLHVSGSVVDAVTGMPIAGFKLVRGYHWADGKPIYFDPNDTQMITGGTFDYYLWNPRPAYAVRIEASGYLPAESRPFAAEERNVQLKLKLQPAPLPIPRVTKADKEDLYRQIAAIPDVKMQRFLQAREQDHLQLQDLATRVGPRNPIYQGQQTRLAADDQTLEDYTKAYLAQHPDVVIVSPAGKPEGAAASQPAAAAPAVPAADPEAAALVREVLDSELWTTRVDSFRIRLEDRWLTLKDGKEQAEGETKDSTELGFDRKRMYHRRESPQQKEIVNQRSWDGRRVLCYEQFQQPRDQGTVGGKKIAGTEHYALFSDPDKNMEPFFLGSVPWLDMVRYKFWWVPANMRGEGVYGNPEDYHLAGNTVFRGVDCRVLDADTSIDTLYVGAADHKLHGIVRRALPRSATPKVDDIELQIARDFGAKVDNVMQYGAWMNTLPADRQRVVETEYDKRTRPLARPLFTMWYEKYKELGKGQWIPMHQGYDMWDVEDTAGQTPHGRRDSTVVDIAVDQPLPAQWFGPMKEGVMVDDWDNDPWLSYVYKEHFSAGEWQAILDEGNQRKAEQKSREAKMNSAVGHPSVEFPDTWVQGKPVKLADLKGKVVLVEFWAVWCGPCRNDVATLNDLAAESRQSGIVVLSVHAAGTSADNVKTAIADEKIKYPVCIDTALGDTSEGRIFNYDHVMELPSAIVIDRTGNIAAEGSLGTVLKVANELAAIAPNTAPAAAPAAAPTTSPAAQADVKQLPGRPMDIRVVNGVLHLEMARQVIDADRIEITTANGIHYAASVANGRVKLLCDGRESDGSRIAVLPEGGFVMSDGGGDDSFVKQIAAIDNAQMDLLQDYALQKGQYIRLIERPFPPARQKLVDQWTPQPGYDLKHGVCWAMNENQELGFAGPVGSEGMDWLQAAQRAGVGWWAIDPQPSQIHWSSGERDMVFEKTASERQKMEALAKIISHDLGKRIEVVRSIQTRPWIVLRGKLSCEGLRGLSTKNKNGLPAIVVSAAPADPAMIPRWEAELGKGDTLVNGKTVLWDVALRQLGAPIVDANAAPNDPPRKRTNFAQSWQIENDIGEMKPTDPDYTAKLQRILDNIKLQVGGEWKIENRPTDIYSLREDAAPATGHTAQPRSR